MTNVPTAQDLLAQGAMSRCGINCRFCPSYRDHVRSDADRQRCSDIWHKFLGFRVDPQTIQPCNGCEESAYYGAEGPDGADCAIRRCARANGARTCAHCSEYLGSCHLHHGARVAQDEGRAPVPAVTDDEHLFFGDIGERLGNRSPEENLAALRAGLRPDEIVKATLPPRG